MFACHECGAVSERRWCPEHGGRGVGGRPDFRERGYGAAFERGRSALLASEPECCIEGCAERASVADHEPSRAALLAAGVQDPDAPRWLQPMCVPHHNSKAARGR